jgi:hypothetical protein
MDNGTLIALRGFNPLQLSARVDDKDERSAVDNQGSNSCYECGAIDKPAEA